MTARLAPGEPVHVTGLWNATPIYHSWIRHDLGLGNWAIDCRPNSPMPPGASMPRAHAARFAIGCRNCYPDQPWTWVPQR